MAPRKFRHGLDDMLSAIDGIFAAVAGKSFEDYEGEWLLKHAVERGIEIVSEAAKLLPREVQALRPEIPWAQVRGIGNVLRHEYHSLSSPIIWRVVVVSCHGCETLSWPSRRTSAKRIDWESA